MEQAGSSALEAVTGGHLLLVQNQRAILLPLEDAKGGILSHDLFQPFNSPMPISSVPAGMVMSSLIA